MEQSERHALPYILPSQAQKHVTHNEAIRMLGAIVQMSLVDIGDNDPPDAPQPGDTYATGDAPTGQWTNNPEMIAAWQDGVWNYYPMQLGQIVWVEAKGEIYIRQKDAWRALGDSFQTLSNMETVGIGTAAQSDTALTISSDKTLLTHHGDDHRLVVNKADDLDTASILFQDGYSGRAEFGLVGGNDFRLKTSDDGATWRDAMVINSASGKAHFPHGISFEKGTFQLVPDGVKGGAYDSVTGLNMLFGNYTRIDNMCFCRCAFTLTADTTESLSPGSTLRLEGLPFNVANLTGAVDQFASGSVYRSIG